ncbi:hypothetical protein GCM10009642_50710 [Nocardiopsis metallicus]
MPGETPACRATSVMPTVRRVERDLVDKDSLPCVYWGDGRHRTDPDASPAVCAARWGHMFTSGLKRVNARWPAGVASGSAA